MLGVVGALYTGDIPVVVRAYGWFRRYMFFSRWGGLLAVSLPLADWSGLIIRLETVLGELRW